MSEFLFVSSCVLLAPAVHVRAPAEPEIDAQQPNDAGDCVTV